MALTLSLCCPLGHSLYAAELPTDVTGSADSTDSVDSAALLTSHLSLLTSPKGGHWSVAAVGNVSYLIPKGPYAGAILHSYGTSFYELRAKWQASPDTDDPFELGLNRPTLQAGLLFGDLSHIHMHKGNTPYESRLSRLWALYGGMQIDFVRRQRWAFGVDLQNGVGYCPSPFNPVDNIDNELLGAHLNIFVNIGLYARHRLSPSWTAMLGVDFKHFSNGSIRRPNLGVNTIGPSLTLQYHPDGAADAAFASSRSASESTHRTPSHSFPGKGLYVETTAHFGMKSLLDHFNVHHTSDGAVYGFLTAMVAPMYRYHRMHATGLAIDYTYADYVYSHRRLDRQLYNTDESYSPHILGVSLRHEVFYHHFSLAVGAGIYLHKQVGFLGRTQDGRFFQNIGLRYSFPFTHDRLFIGYNVKAHRFSKADSDQLVLGVRLGKNKRIKK